MRSLTSTRGRRPLRVGRVTVWVLGIVLSVLAARYFLVPPPFLTPPAPVQDPVGEAVRNVAPYLYMNHKGLFLPHIAGGIVAMLLGLVQFIGRVRDSRPRIHRAVGYVYVAAVMLAGITGLPLSFLTIEGLPAPMRPQFYPVTGGFLSLSIAWTFVSGMALYRARQYRYDEHRKWMTRSYSLTFSAVTVRLAAPVLLLVTGDIVFTVNGAILSWPLNLLVAEALIRRRRTLQGVPVPASV